MRKKREMPRNIIFDLDGVLWDLDLKNIGKMIAEKLGVDKKYHFEMSKQVYEAILAVLSRTEERMTKRKMIEIFKETIPNLELYGISAETLYKELSSKNYNYCYNNHFAREVIKQLQNSGYRIFIKSNWFEDVQKEHLERYGYELKSIQKIVGIENEYLKPNPKSLEPIIEDENPRNFIIIGDTLKKEMALGNYYKMISIWLNEKHEEFPKDPNLIPTYMIYDIRELIDILCEKR